MLILLRNLWLAGSYWRSIFLVLLLLQNIFFGGQFQLTSSHADVKVAGKSIPDYMAGWQFMGEMIRGLHAICQPICIRKRRIKRRILCAVSKNAVRHFLLTGFFNLVLQCFTAPAAVPAPLSLGAGTGCIQIPFASAAVRAIG